MSDYWRRVGAIVLTLGVGAALLMLSAAGTPEAEGGPAPVDIDKLVAKATFIFKGTVAKLKAANMPGVPVSDRTVVVRVDEVRHGPKAMAHYKGKEITVRLQPKHAVKAGEQLVFYTISWLFGKGLAVQEVGRHGPDAASRKQLDNALQKQANAPLHRQLASAKLVVSGKVTAVKPAPKAGKQQVSEHDPQWRQATITIEKVEKGKHEAKTVTVLFPASRDVLWYHAPKFKAGQEGVWLLHSDQVKQLPAKTFTAIKPLDFHPKGQLEHIRKMLKASR
jgi:hypothetical protein